MKRLYVVLAAVLTGNAAAASPDLECTGSSQVEIANCVAETAERAEQAMKFMLQQAEAQAAELDDITGREVAVPALQAAQSAWEAYRDAECNYAGALFGGGSGSGIGINSCRIELTRARSRELQARP